MLRVGIAGLGFMGMVHYLSYQRLESAKVTAIATREPKRLAGDWTDIKGNFGPSGLQMDLSGIETYLDVEEMLANDELDAVDITLPPNMHADIAVRALESGKHVFCEKPLALNKVDGQRMIDAARASSKILLVGHVLPYFPEYAWARKIIDEGKHGQVIGGAFRRVISDPAWLKHYWTAENVGGPMLDLHVHDAHFIRLLFGKPSRVSTIGRSRNGLAEFWHSQFHFENERTEDITVEATSGTINQQGRPFDHGFEIHLEHATLVFQFAVFEGEGRYLCPPTLLDDTGVATVAELGSDDPMDAFADEIEEVVNCLSSGQPSSLLGGELAVDALDICQAEAESLASKKVVLL